MLDLQTSQALTIMISFFIAYIISIPIAGAFRAWVALQMGDDTAQDLGYLTLNPLVHADYIGVIILLLFRVGWGKIVPINVFNITGPWRNLKIIAAYLADIFAYITLTFLTIMTMAICFSSKVSIAPTIMQIGSSESLAGAFLFIGQAMIELNIILAALNIILVAADLVVSLCVEWYTENVSEINQVLLLFLPVIVRFISVLIFVLPMRSLMVQAVLYVSMVIVQALGL